MGIYTVLEDKRVDEAVEKDLHYIVERVTGEFAGTKEVILGGGFGRGEGSVIVAGDNVEVVNDYDIFFVFDGEVTAPMLSALSKDIIRKLDIRLLDLMPLRSVDLPTLEPTQFNYDLKYGGVHLWGESCLPLVPEFEEGKVKWEAGKLLLNNRLICALECYSRKFVENGTSEEELFFLVNQLGKVVSACVEALLMEKGLYHHSYRRRQEIFEKEFSHMSSLCELNAIATDFKLRPTRHPQISALEYWERAIDEYLGVYCFYLADNGSDPADALWDALKKDGAGKITVRPIDRIELMILISFKASSIKQEEILSRVKKELEELSGRDIAAKGWEELRVATVDYWFELFH